ncbi:MAG: GFA family protein [Steroidobacteraceae bacterium]|nr:GFA family protein [Steroidobacteraceae bacterium]
MDTTLEGACLCGTVRWRFDRQPSSVVNCHCTVCRRHHGGSYATFAVGSRDGFRWLAGEDAVRRWARSPGFERAFCAHCGVKVPAHAGEEVRMPAGNFGAGYVRAPELHAFAASRAPWIALDDGLPAYDAFPPGKHGTPAPSPVSDLEPGAVGGACLCGAVAWQVDGPPLKMYHCHCERCRKARGSAFATNVFYAFDAFRWRRGEDRVSRYALPGARFFGTASCRDCGAAVPRPQRDRGVAVVAAGSLDVDPGIRPSAHIYVGSSAGWDRIHDPLPRYPEGPPA